MAIRSFLVRAVAPGIVAAAGAFGLASQAPGQVRYQLEDAAAADGSEVELAAYYHGHRPRCNCPQCQQYYTPCPQGTVPQYPQPAPYAPIPGQPPMPEPPRSPSDVPMPPSVPDQVQMPPAAAPYTSTAQAAGGLSGSEQGPAYIDDARVWNMVRFRFDAGFDNEFPDRAEFFYPQCGCFPGAPGPGDPNIPQSASSVDFQEYQLYLEYALHDRFSVFVDVPFRSVNFSISDEAAGPPANFQANDDASGLSDIQAGFKLALVACPWQYDTIQLRVYTPTGEGDRGLGTEHVSIEPAYLAYRQWSDRLRFNGEFRVWVPISDTRLDLDGSPFDGELYAGTVLRYGIGVTYDLHQTYDCCCNVTDRCSAVFEAVGWSVLDGLKFRPTSGGGEVLDASGDTIINLKLGARWTHCYTSLFVGYGHAVTDQAWYRDVIRAELAYLY